MTGNFVPISSPLLAPICNRHKVKEKSLLLVGAAILLKARLFDTLPSPPRWVAYRKMKRQFITALHSSPRESLIYRPHLRGSPNLQDGEYVQQHFPDVPIFEGGLTKKMLRCQLLVLDHPGTTLHLALAANVPTVCFWHSDDWPQSRQADPYFEGLRKSGILHSTPESAACYINEIWGDVAGWWSDRERQSARQQWCQEYARTSRFWWLEWISCLWRLANNQLGLKKI
jgi:putative transferase (TIGR04331 family)